MESSDVPHLQKETQPSLSSHEPPPPYPGELPYPYPTGQSFHPQPHPPANAAYKQQQYPPGTYPMQHQAPYPQQTAYPHQQSYSTAYPLQSYPSQQQGYVSQQQGYSQNVAPYPQSQMLQQGSNVVLVQPHHQVGAVSTTRVYRAGNTTHNAVVVAVILMFILFFCFYFTYCCLIPALIFGCNAQSAGNRGDQVADRKNSRISFGLSIAGAISAIVIPAIYFGGLFGGLSANN